MLPLGGNKQTAIHCSLPQVWQSHCILLPLAPNATTTVPWCFVAASVCIVAQLIMVVPVITANIEPPVCYPHILLLSLVAFLAPVQTQKTPCWFVALFYQFFPCCCQLCCCCDYWYLLCVEWLPMSMPLHHNIDDIAAALLSALLSAASWLVLVPVLIFYCWWH